MSEESPIKSIRNLEDDDPHFSYAVKTFSWKEKTFYLLGTIHGSKESIKHVEKIIEKTKPDCLVLELAHFPKREYNFNEELQKGKKKGKDLFSENKTLSFLYSIGFFAQPIIEPAVGTPEIARAAYIGKEKGIEIICADRSNEITILRFLNKAPFFKKVTFFINALLGRFVLGYPLKFPNPFSFENWIEIDKEKRGITSDFAQFQLKFIHERDLFYIDHLKNAPGKIILGVFGMAHIHGVIRCWEFDIPMKELMTIDEDQRSTDIFIRSFQFENHRKDDNQSMKQTTIHKR